MLLISKIKSYKCLRPLFDFGEEVTEEVKLTNYPVNLNHITWLETDATIDVVGDKKAPAIVFHLVHSECVTWAGYETTEQRNFAVQKILMKMHYGVITHV